MPEQDARTFCTQKGVYLRVPAHMKQTLKTPLLDHSAGPLLSLHRGGTASQSPTAPKGITNPAPAGITNQSQHVSPLRLSTT